MNRLLKSNSLCWSFGIPILVVHITLVAWSSWIHSPNVDEAAHLASGVTILTKRSFELYSVNPPLVKSIAALPLLPLHLSVPADATNSPRPEFSVGVEFLKENQDSFRPYFFWARLACLPFSLLGAVVCFLWARDLFGNVSGLAALAIWCLSPNIIGLASTICPDVAATSLGLLTCYIFSKWLKNVTLKNTLLLGIALGFSELAKMSWIIFIVILPSIWLIFQWNNIRRKRRIVLRSGISLLTVFLISLAVLNSFYLFDGTMTKIGDISFRSQFFRRIRQADFFGFQTAKIPLPLPVDYIKGMDIQKVDFESGRFDSYLLGKWQSGKGWYSYYFVGLLVKVPIPVLVLCIMSATFCIILRSRFIRKSDLTVLLLPPLIFFLFISSQNGFSRHFRYILPVLPFLHVLASGCFNKSIEQQSIYRFSALLLLWMAVGSLMSYPHSLSYFNAIAGGSQNGYRILLDSAIDWGQDFYLLKDWQEKHTDAKPFFVACYSEIPPKLFGIESDEPPTANQNSLEYGRPLFPPVGWYAISVHELMHHSNKFIFFRRQKPTTRIGGSINIYHVEEKDHTQ